MGGMAVAAVRMALLAIVAVAALLAIMTTIRPGVRALAPLRRRLGRGLEALERLGGGHEIGGEGSNGDLLPRGALDVAQVPALLGAAECNGDSGGSGTRGAADAV